MVSDSGSHVEKYAEAMRRGEWRLPDDAEIDVDPDMPLPVTVPPGGPVRRDVALCCDYRDHGGNGCACPAHPRSAVHPFGTP